MSHLLPSYRLLLAFALVIPTLGDLAARVEQVQSNVVIARQNLSAAQGALAGSLGTVSASASASASGSGAASTSASAASLDSACQATANANQALNSVNGQLQVLMPLVGAIGALPVVGSKARAQADTLQVGTDLAAAGASLCQGMGPLQSLLTSAAGASGSSGTSTGASARASDTLQSLATAGPSLQQALDRLTNLQSTLAGMSPDQINGGPDGPQLALLNQKLPSAIENLKDASALVSLLGGSGTKRYLLVSQNLDEARPTGGFIGSAGVIEITNGSLKVVEYGTSQAYATPPNERVVPPDFVTPYLGGAYWQLPGANWSASFPDVARQMSYFYSLARPGEQVDGVIALDQDGIADLLKALGGVDIPEYNEHVTADNVQAKLDQYVHDYADATSEQSRKEFTAALTLAVLQQALGAGSDQLPALTQAVQSALADQHLLVSVTDPAAAQVLAQRGWDGSLLPPTGDALLLTDAETTDFKISRDVVRTANYQVDLTNPAAPQATLNVTYTDQVDPAAIAAQPSLADYGTLLQVYVPAGAQLVDSQGFAATVGSRQECNYTVLDGEVRVHPGQQTQLQLRYQLPASVVRDGTYNLLLQSQPGQDLSGLAVQVAGANGLSASLPAPTDGQRNGQWQLPLATGASFGSAPLPGATASTCQLPLVQAQQLPGPAELDIPAIGLTTHVTNLGFSSDGGLQAPPRPDEAGWYQMSGLPGAPGNSVYAGHVDWGQNTAVFWGLHNLQPGDEVDVRDTAGQVHRYAVQWNKSFDNQDPPIQEILGGSDDSLLTLITCDGVYDKSIKEYSNRRVVRAKLIG